MMNRCFLINYQYILAIITIIATILLNTNCTPILESANNVTDTDSGLPQTIEARFADAINELEWLLHQLVNILTEMVDGIENDNTLLQNNNFRLILIQVIKRIDYILEHFEMVGPTIMTHSVHKELDRINCVRIRLMNYLSQSRRYDDSRCTQHQHHDHHHQQQQHHGQHHKTPTNEEILPLLTQIVSLLVQISNQMNSIERNLSHGMASHEHQHQHHHPHQHQHQHHNSSMSWTSRPTINWDQVLSQSTTPATPNRSTIDWDRILEGNQPTPNNPLAMTTAWPELISHIMDSLETTTPTPNTPAPIGSALDSNKAWEDVMNELIRQWNGMNIRLPRSIEQSRSISDKKKVDMDECIQNILALAKMNKIY